MLCVVMICPATATYVPIFVRIIKFNDTHVRGGGGAGKMPRLGETRTQIEGIEKITCWVLKPLVRKQ